MAGAEGERGFGSRASRLSVEAKWEWAGRSLRDMAGSLVAPAVPACLSLAVIGPVGAGFGRPTAGSEPHPSIPAPKRRTTWPRSALCLHLLHIHHHFRRLHHFHHFRRHPPPRRRPRHPSPLRALCSQLVLAPSLDHMLTANAPCHAMHALSQRPPFLPSSLPTSLLGLDRHPSDRVGPPLAPWTP